MAITSSRLIPYHLPLHKSWSSAQGTFKSRDGWLIRICDEEGVCGVGDCAPLPQAGTEAPDIACQWLKQTLTVWANQEPQVALAALNANQDSPPAAHCGIETALTDLIAQRAGIPLAHWLNPDAVDTILVNANLGTLDNSTVDRLEEADGFSVIKLKVGLASVETELALLKRVAERLPPGISLRLDANQAWGREEAEHFINGCSDLPIESIEEPLSAPTLDTLKQLQRFSPFPLAIDESLNSLEYEKIFQIRPVERLSLKPMVLGGLSASLDLAKRAYESGMACVVTTTVDSAVGVWAATHLAAALGIQGQQVTHGLATSSWLTEDIADGPVIRQGKITLGDKAGLALHLPNT